MIPLSRLPSCIKARPYLILWLLQTFLTAILSMWQIRCWNIFPDQSDYVPSPQLDAFVKSKLPPDTQFSIPYMTVTSTLKAIRNIDHKKACGVDEIHSLLLKKISQYYSSGTLSYF